MNDVCIAMVGYAIGHPRKGAPHHMSWMDHIESRSDRDRKGELRAQFSTERLSEFTLWQSGHLAEVLQMFRQLSQGFNKAGQEPHTFPRPGILRGSKSGWYIGASSFIDYQWPSHWKSAP